jgi:pentatricopeptide repeat domain-containing protein 1
MISCLGRCAMLTQPNQHPIQKQKQKNSRAGDWPRALALLEKMEAQGLGPDIVAYTTAITALGRGGQERAALRLFERMRGRPGLQLDERSYHAALDACARGGNDKGEEEAGAFWRQALELVGEMEAAGMNPGRLGYQSAVQACAQAGRWEEAVGVLRGMRGT